jgi:hypothetical protein
MKTQVSPREKMNRPAKAVDIPAAIRKHFGQGKMLIPCPLDVDALVHTVTRGRLVTQSELRRKLAEANRADVTCPITTAIFVRISAEAAEEDLRLGKQKVTPYWRVVRHDGTLNEKLSQQAKRLREEGYVVEQGPRRNTMRVKNYRELLTAL